MEAVLKAMVNLGLIHYIYLIWVVLIILIICMKKNVVLPCIVGIAVIGFIFSGNIFRTLQIVFMAILVSGRQFVEIIIIIALVYAMSKALRETGVDELMINPISGLIRSRNAAFLIIGFTMLIFSWFIWPSPSAVLVGAILLPVTAKAGLEPIWTAVSMSIFGPGMALSSDFFIQAAPSVTSKTAGISNPYNLIKAVFPLWLVMSCVTVLTAFFMMRRDMRANTGLKAAEDVKLKQDVNHDTEQDIKKDVRQDINEDGKQDVKTDIGKESVPPKKRIISIVIPVLFLADIVFMYIYNIKGTDAAALISGTAIMIMVITSLIIYGIKDALAKSEGFIREGFAFSMKVFAPVIVIAAFFYLGSGETASSILGVKTKGILTEAGMYLAYKFPLSKVSAVIIQSSISGMLGIGGSGFAGLPLIGTLSQVFSSALPMKREYLAAIGQIITIWVGGGTIVPWSVVPVAAICGVEPFELVKKNIIPVSAGFLAMIITTIIII